MSTAKGPSKRNCFESLEKKVEVIKYHEKNPSISIRALGDKFDCGKTQIAYILKNKASILLLFHQNAQGSRHITGKARASEFADINDALYKWFCIATSKNIHPGGPELMEKAKEISDKLGKPNFKGSRGWLDKWKKRFNIKQLKICGESADVDGATVDSWKERLPEIVADYEKENIWNMDETGLFWRALPDKGFGQKKMQQRLTVALFVNANGKKENLSLYGSQKTQDVYVGLTNHSFLLPILANPKLG